MTKKGSVYISIGIDPGTKNGAIAIVDDYLQVIHVAKGPYKSEQIKSRKVKPKLNTENMMYEQDYRKRTWTDFQALREILEPFIKRKRVIYTIERATVRPDEGGITAFVNGNSLGIYEGQVSFLNPIAFYEPLPTEWKSELKINSDKNSAINYAESLFKCDLRDYLKHGKKDDIAEALLLAFYGLRQYMKETRDGDSYEKDN